MNRFHACLALVSLLGALTVGATGCEADDVAAEPADGGTAEPDAAPPSCPKPTAGPTRHEYDVAEDEVWSADASPHVVDYDVRVRDGHTLTIEPCAEVLLKKGTHIQVAFPGTPNVGGTLIAEGTADRPIRFAGSDGESWASLYVHAPGTARLSYVTFEGGGGGDFEDGSTIDVLGDDELPAKPLLYVDHVTIKGSKGAGVWLQRRATFIAGSKDLSITGSGNDEHPFPLQIEEHAIDALPTGSYTGNRIDEILLRTSGTGVAGSGLTVDATLHERGVPYRMGKSKLDDFIVGPPGEGPPTTLTIEAGVVMRFEKETALRVQTFTSEEPANATIRALGTAARPIVFTSAAAAPAPGDWRGLWFGGVPMDGNALDHVRIEYAGFDCRCSLATCSDISEHDGAIVLTGRPAGAFVTNSSFKAIAGHAVTQGFTGEFVDFRPTNTFDAVSGCVQTLPRPRSGSCSTPLPACDGT